MAEAAPEANIGGQEQQTPIDPNEPTFVRVERPSQQSGLGEKLKNILLSLTRRREPKTPTPPQAGTSQI